MNVLYGINIQNLQCAFKRFNLLLLKRYRLEGIRSLYIPEQLGLNHFTQMNKKRIEYKGIDSLMSQLKRINIDRTLSTDDLFALIACSSEDKSLIKHTINYFKIYFEQVKDHPKKANGCATTLMRMLYVQNAVDEAFQLILDEEYGKYFKQLTSYQLVMDKLYKNGRYEDVKLLMNKIIIEWEINIPLTCLTLTTAANYKIGTEEALEDSVRLLRLVSIFKTKIPYRPIVFSAGLALKLGKVATSLEILGNSESSTYFPISNLTVLAKAKMGNVDEVLHIIKMRTLNDISETSKRNEKSFCYDVIDEVECAVNETLDLDKINQIKHLKTVLETMKLLSPKSLDEEICAPSMNVSGGDEQRKRRNKRPSY